MKPIIMSSKRILLVEDDCEQAQILLSILEDGGYVVTCAVDAPVAIGAARTMRPDLILLDVQLRCPHYPQLLWDGLDVAKFLKRLNPKRRIPTVIATAGDATLSQSRATTLGVPHVLQKPFKRQELLETVALALQATDHAGISGCDSPLSSEPRLSSHTPRTAPRRVPVSPSESPG
jgi:CheY-like chemotaxis protein